MIKAFQYLQQHRIVHFVMLAVLVVGVFGGMFLLGDGAFAASDFGLKNAADATKVLKTGTSPTAESVAKTIGTLMKPFLLLIGFVLFVFIVYAGAMWATSAGNDEKIGKAKKIIASAIIGLVIVMGAYFITTFVVTQITTATDVLK